MPDFPHNLISPHILISLPKMKSLPIECQFESERFKRYIQSHPEEAREYALNYFEDFLTLAHEYKKLQARHDQLQSELIKLHFRKSPSRHYQKMRV